MARISARSKSFHQQFTSLSVEKIALTMPLRYLLPGGVSIPVSFEQSKLRKNDDTRLEHTAMFALNCRKKVGK